MGRRALAGRLTCDWRRNRHPLTRLFLSNFRLGCLLRERPSTPAVRVVFGLHKMLETLLQLPLGVGEIRAGCDIGEGLHLPHRVNGIVVHRAARIGRNVAIYHQVTIGSVKRDGRWLTPVVGDDVWIFPGAKILGGVTIGDRAVIGANAVVVDDVPPGATVVAPKAIMIGDAS